MNGTLPRVVIEQERNQETVPFGPVAVPASRFQVVRPQEGPTVGFGNDVILSPAFPGQPVSAVDTTEFADVPTVEVVLADEHPRDVPFENLIYREALVFGDTTKLLNPPSTVRSAFPVPTLPFLEVVIGGPLRTMEVGSEGVVFSLEGFLHGSRPFLLG